MNVDIQRHCSELARCNQRGGRMLSVFDLLEAQTLDLDLAALLMAGIARGASFMVGARPGGAGKTTVMCALLNLVPRTCSLTAATTHALRAAQPAIPPVSTCYICHEIGAGRYFACLWGAELRAYCALADRDQMRATNLHADDLDEARTQLCDENNVPTAHFNAFHLLVFLRVRGGYGNARRWIAKVYASDGVAPHRLIYDASRGGLIGQAPFPSATDAAWVGACRTFLEETHATGIRTIEEARAAFLAWA